MRKILVALCLGALLNLQAVTLNWNTPVTIPLGASGGPNYNIDTAFDPDNHQLIAAWGDTSTQLPYYTIYNGSTWSTAAVPPLGASAGVHANTSLVWDGSSHQILMAWVDKVSAAPYYTMYDGSSWSTPVTIPLAPSTQAVQNVSLVFDSENNQVIVVWVDASTSPATLYYTVYNGSSWATPAPIWSGNISVSATTTPSLVYDSGTNQVMLVWLVNTGAYVPHYSVYDGTSWSAASAIPLGSSAGVQQATLAVDATPDETIITWLDVSNTALYYSVYSAGSWSSNPGTLPLGVGTQPTIPTLAYDGAVGQMAALWQDNLTAALYYSTFDGTAWSTAAALPLDGQSSGAWTSTLTYNPASHQLFAIWGDINTGALYSATTQVVGPTPPGSATAQLLFDNYINATDRVHLLQWTASSDATTVGYQISSGAGVEGSTTATQIYLRNRVKGQSYTYSIAAYNELGITGTPLVVSAEG